jgi:hypothetical protein
MQSSDWSGLESIIEMDSTRFVTHWPFLLSSHWLVVIGNLEWTPIKINQCLEII